MTHAHTKHSKALTHTHTHTHMHKAPHGIGMYAWTYIDNIKPEEHTQKHTHSSKHIQTHACTHKGTHTHQSTHKHTHAHTKVHTLIKVGLLPPSCGALIQVWQIWKVTVIWFHTQLLRARAKAAESQVLFCENEERFRFTPKSDSTLTRNNAIYVPRYQTTAR